MLGEILSFEAISRISRMLYQFTEGLKPLDYSRLATYVIIPQEFCLPIYLQSCIHIRCSELPSNTSRPGLR